MSFLLQEPARRKKNQNGGGSRFSVRSHSNDNIAIGDNGRMVRGLESTGFNRGKRKNSQQQVSGNQIMLQRQQRKTATTKLQKHQHQQQMKQRQQNENQCIEQEQENLGDYTMERVMEDLQILEQQQQEAKRKLESAQATKQKRLDQLRQLNTLLENKSFSNGALRAKLQQSRDFLSVATRELGNRKLTAGRLQDGIAAFDSKLKRGLESAKLIQVCSAKIDSFLMVIEHKITSMNRLRMKRMQMSTEVRQKYEQTETKDCELRSAIQDAHKRAREWREEKVSLRTQISKLEKDKVAAQNTAQMAELQVQAAQDKIKIEADRTSSVKRNLMNEIDAGTKKIEIASSKMNIGSVAIKTLRGKIQEYQGRIVECKKAEEHPHVKDDAPIFDQHIFREELARIEEETRGHERDLLALEQSVEATELACTNAGERTLENDKEASLLAVAAKSLTDDEKNRQNNSADFEASLESARAEVTKLEENFCEMEETRVSEARSNLTAISDYDVDIKQRFKGIEDLKSKMNQEDIALKTKVRLFEETDKVPLLQKLEKVKDKSTVEENEYNDFLRQASEASMEAELQADFEHKFNEETTKWESKNKMIVSRCEEHLQKYPILEKIDFKFDNGDDKDKQIKDALTDIERDCSARKSAVEAMKEQEDLARKKRNAELEKTKAKLKKKEELQARLKKRQYRRRSNRRVAGTKPKGEVAHALEFTGAGDDSLFNFGRNRIVERRQRRRKGSDFFDPGSQGDDEKGNDLTPTNPRRLISSFLSQSSGQRVRWADGDVPDDDSHNIVDDNDDGQIEGRDTKKVTAPTTLATNTNTTKEEIGSLDIEKASAIIGRRPRGRQRSRNASKSSRNRSTREKQPESHLERYDTPPSDMTLTKTTGSTSREKERNTNPGFFTENVSLVASRSRSTSSKSARKKKLNGRPLPTADSNDTFKSRKFNNKSTDLETQDKRRRREDVNKSSSGKLSAERKNHLGYREMTKKKPSKPDVNLPVLENEGNGSGLDANFSEGGKRKEEKRYSRHRKKETVKEKENISAANDHIPLIGKGSRTKNSNGGDKKMSKEREARKNQRNSFADIDRDANFLQAKNTKPANRDKLAGAERNSRGKDCDGSKSVRREHIEEGRKRDLGRKRTSGGGSPSRRSRSKESKDMSRKLSNKGVSEGSSMQFGTYDSCEIDGEKSDTPIRSITKRFVGEALEKPGGKMRKKSSGGASKVGRRSDNGLSNPGPHDKNGKKLSITKASSASQGNGNRKKRKVQRDNVSVSSSKTSVTARRRKKRNTAGSQKSSTTNFGDESCDFNFQ